MLIGGMEKGDYNNADFFQYSNDFLKGRKHESGWSLRWTIAGDTNL